MKDNGGRAFPSGQTYFAGMSLRDWFAGMALQGMLATPGMRYSEGSTAQGAYAYADVMLKERSKE
jgi:hypothetical protein